MIAETVAILKYLARQNPESGLLGQSRLQQAQVEQWLAYANCHIGANVELIENTLFGYMETFQDEFNAATSDIKSQIKTLDTRLNGKDWLVGERLTLADLYVAALLTTPYSLTLDAGYLKAMGNVTQWYVKMTTLPSFVEAFGNQKLCSKPLQPPKKLPVKPKAEPKKVEKKEAPKPKEEEKAAPPKKDINPLDALPPSPWNFFDFKTLMVNHKDKAGAGMEALKEQYDKDGYTFWFLQYDKYKGEGEVLYKTENLMKGFLQRFDHFRKHCLARVCILGEEPKLEIEGVWCFRGQEIPFEMKDHPQFEYYHHRKIDFNNKKDFQLIREFWSAEIGKKARGMKIQSVMWHK